MAKKEKELNKKLKLDSIDWVEVLENLDVKENQFTNQEIKYALKKTGRNFNLNGPFYKVVKDFIDALEDAVETKKSGVQNIYCLRISKEEAKTRLGWRKLENEKEYRKGIDYSVFPKSVKKIETPLPNEEEVVEEVKDKKEDLFAKLILEKVSSKELSDTLYLLAIYLKYETKELLGSQIKAEIDGLGLGVKYYRDFAARIREVLKKANFYELQTRKGPGSSWTLIGEIELIDAYTKLGDAYERLTGEKHKNLDDFILSSKKAELPEKKEKVVFEKLVKQTSKINVRQEDDDVKWKKWLLLSALKNRLGTSCKIESLLMWIEKERHEVLSQEEAIKLLREIQQDIEDSLEFKPGNIIALSEKYTEVVSRIYDPRKIKEKIYVKLNLNLEDTRIIFPGIQFDLEESMGNGKYLYEVTIDRSYTSEIYTKKLIEFIRIQGKLYTTETPIIKRAIKVLDIEESEKKVKETTLKNLENY